MVNSLEQFCFFQHEIDRISTAFDVDTVDWKEKASLKVMDLSWFLWLPPMSFPGN